MHEKAIDLLRIFNLEGLADQPRRPTCRTASSASWRSPAPWPPNMKLLLLDEPAAGMNPTETAELLHVHQYDPRYVPMWPSCSSSTI